MLVSIEEFSLVTDFTAVAATMNNIGPGLEMVGPIGNYSEFGILSKIVLIFDMLAGVWNCFRYYCFFRPLMKNHKRVYSLLYMKTIVVIIKLKIRNEYALIKRRIDMAFCGKCGAQINDGESSALVAELLRRKWDRKKRFEDGLNNATEGVGKAFNKFNYTQDSTGEFDAADIQAHKSTAWLSYLGPLVLVRYWHLRFKVFQFHDVQGVTLCALWVVYTILSVGLSFIKVTTTD